MSFEGLTNAGLIAGTAAKMASATNPVSAAVTFGLPAVKALGSMLKGRSKNKNDQELLRQEIEGRLRLAELEDKSRRDLNNQNVASEESMANPFRHQINQGRSAMQLDAMERASYTRPTIAGGSARYAGNKPQISGGFNYEVSPEMRAAAGSLKQSVLAGRTAPTMTNPANYGRTATLDLLGVADGDLDPTLDSAFSTGAPMRPGAAGVDIPDGMGLDEDDTLGLMAHFRKRPR